VDFQAVAGALALDSGDFAVAEGFFARAAELDPTNAAHRFALAKAQLGNDDLFQARVRTQAAVGTDEDETFRLRALRELVSSYLSAGEPQAALRECRTLIAFPITYFRMIFSFCNCSMAPVTTDSRRPRRIKAKGRRKREERRRAPDLDGQCWTGTRRLRWVQNEAPDVGRMPGLEPGFAGCYLMLGDWPKLLNATEPGRGQKPNMSAMPTGPGFPRTEPRPPCGY
jgi:hypothetical protein